MLGEKGAAIVSFYDSPSAFTNSIHWQNIYRKLLSVQFKKLMGLVTIVKRTDEGQQKRSAVVIAGRKKMTRKASALQFMTPLSE